MQGRRGDERKKSREVVQGGKEIKEDI